MSFPSIRIQHEFNILEANNSSGFTCSQLKRDFASGQIIPQVSPIPDLDVLDLGLMLE